MLKSSFSFNEETTMIRPILAICFVAIVLPSDNRTEEQERAALQGEWEEVSREFDGRPSALPKEKSNVRMVFANDKVLIKRGDAVTSESEYQLDLSKKPYVLTKKRVMDGAGNPYRLAYSVDGEKLTICSNGKPENPTPTELATRPGDKRWLSVWQRSVTKKP
jgi:uncharacterized protein (TIGR03067 family)